jgi:hypothetical protein
VHFYALVVIPADGDVDELVAQAMAPFDDSADSPDRLLWDWYQIGGRYTGSLSGYDPWSDPSLLETCEYCGGSGLRDDDVGRAARAADPAYTCNGCRGSGERWIWSTGWPRHDGDVVDAVDVIVRLPELLPDERLPYAIIVHGSETPILCERWNGEEMEQVLDADGIRAAMAAVLHTRLRAGLRDRVVVVDYHF